MNVYNSGDYSAAYRVAAWEAASGSKRRRGGAAIGRSSTDDTL